MTGKRNRATRPGHNPMGTRGNSATAQRKRLLVALEARPVSTLDARKELDILHPAARVQELRQRGINIVTHWHDERTELGVSHRIAKYVLLEHRDKGGEQ